MLKTHTWTFLQATVVGVRVARPARCQWRIGRCGKVRLRSREGIVSWDTGSARERKERWILACGYQD